jgi:hypothetical protein
MLHHRFEIPTYNAQKGCTGKDAGPTRRFTISPGVGPGATVGTLKTRYPHVQASNQDERQDGCTCPHVSWLWLPPPRLRGAPEPPRAPWPRLLAQRSSGAATCFMALAPTTRPRGSFGTVTCPLGSSSRLLAQGSSRAATSLVGGLNVTQAIKVNKYLLATRPS